MILLLFILRKLANVLIMSQSSESNRGRQSSVTPSELDSEIATEATESVADAGDTGSVFEAPITARGVVPLLLNRPKRDTSKKRTHTQVKLSIGSVSNSYSYCFH